MNGVMRPDCAAARLVGWGDPSLHGCPSYAPRAGGSQPALAFVFKGFPDVIFSTSDVEQILLKAHKSRQLQLLLLA